jgi:UDP-glucuronate 4-epimerase
MKVLITGAAGFIGYHLSKLLLEDDSMFVVGVDNMNEDYYGGEIKQGRLEDLQKTVSGFRFINLDLLDKPDLHALLMFEQPDVVVHLAGCANISYCTAQPYKAITENEVASVYLAECCVDIESVKTIIYPMTSNGDSLYAHTKKTSWEVINRIASKNSIQVMGIRFSTLYGEWGRPDMAVWKFVESILEGKEILVYGDGESERDYTHISDAVEAIKLWLYNNKGEGNDLYDVCSGENHTTKYLIHLIEEELGIKANVKMVEEPEECIKTYVLNTSKINWLGFHSRVSLSTGVHRFVEWYKQYKNIG